MATGRRNASDGPDHGQRDQDRRHEGRHGDRMRRIVQDLDDWDARLRRRCESEDIVLPVGTEAEAQRDEHQQAQEDVEEGTPHHRRGENAGSVFQLFGTYKRQHPGLGSTTEES